MQGLPPHRDTCRCLPAYDSLLVQNIGDEEREMGIGAGFPVAYFQWAKWKLALVEEELPDDFPAPEGIEANWPRCRRAIE